MAFLTGTHFSMMYCSFGNQDPQHILENTVAPLKPTCMHTSETDYDETQILRYFTSSWLYHHHLMFLKAVCEPRQYLHVACIFYLVQFSPYGNGGKCLLTTIVSAVYKLKVMWEVHLFKESSKLKVALFVSCISYKMWCD